jgi:uncharacterized protein
MTIWRAGLVGLLLTAPLALPALAQVPPAEIGQRNVPAPWWMQQPVIASIGMVRTEVPANRASFDATFSALGKTADIASAAAAAKVAEIDRALRALGADRVRITTVFTTRPLYEQYRDKEGNFQTNERPDKIERYAVEARLSLEIRDTAALESAYAAVLAARPDATGQVQFRLQPGNEIKTWLLAEAVKDAARRARDAAANAGARLGAAKVIDPSGRVCRTDVLAGWPSYGGGSLATDVSPPSSMMAEAARAPRAERAFDFLARAAAPASAPQVSLQPPLVELTDDACVIYALLP